jgi:hypothetical protein
MKRHQSAGGAAGRLSPPGRPERAGYRLGDALGAAGDGEALTWPLVGAGQPGALRGQLTGLRLR